MFKLKYNYVTNTSDEPYIQYWFAKKLSGIAGSTVTGEGADFNIVSPTERSIRQVVLKGDTTQETSPTPDSPQTVNTVTGDQTITITKGSDVQTYNLSLTSKNLLNRANADANYILKWADGTNVYNEGSITSEYMPTEQTNVYASNYKIIPFFYDSSKTYLGHLASDGETLTTLSGSGLGFDTFTVPSGYDIAYMRLVYRASSTGNPADMTDKDIMLNTGSTALTYESYYNYELCKIGDYQDYIYKDGEKWYVKKNTAKLTLNGSESYGSVGTPTFFYLTSITPDYANTDNKPISNYFTGVDVYTPAQGGIPANSICFLGTNTRRLYIKYLDKFDTITSLKTWLSTHNTDIYYRVATPTDTEITDETLLGQLNTILSNGYLSAGTNTVQTSATGLPIIINIKA